MSEPTRESVVDSSFMQIDEPKYLGSRLPEETVLTDAAGQDFRIGDLRGKPLILMLSYYGCDGTCPVMNAELAKALAKVDRFRLGEDYRVLTVSFDRKDTPASAAEFLDKTGAVPEGMRGGWRHAV
ncbi:MAG: SCO family protein, partial [Rhodocyclaceae bacterium]|nr:SCO family protein [Rhodocyclaceae bacterium]